MEINIIYLAVTAIVIVRELRHKTILISVETRHSISLVESLEQFRFKVNITKLYLTRSYIFVRSDPGFIYLKLNEEFPNLLYFSLDFVFLILL